ncbi:MULTISPECIES: MocR-like pyridoxine biosynthesis transcription factor PdxR [Streptomyces]|uniref:GntR family transcriptional regulator n=1 Tax=Streptomyces spororaveus TaxID=284039 RepID=A0ABQ3T4V5_9ACTN|nr:MULTISPECIES: PLP-dependent aminotransferase family protein [Streptomyces]MCM9076767.1 PLP-dependent aminotransferase family protein [Streptomyces spororaveus]MCX5308575.1 PLP-dependent aminotransferase family protein [Streptomyces sp. NBC_00160]GHI75428.1 GntR family transcriptional regulator [Streptomyces spororaveus]
MSRSNDDASEGSKSPSGSDFLQLDVGQAPPGGRTEWLAGRLRAAIADGTLPVGSRLPASRVLAAELRVSRGLVTEAYQRLAETGQVSGRGRGGTVVVAAPAPVAAPSTAPARGGLVDALRAVPCRIDLSPGVPDLAAFPRTAWLQAERRVLSALTPADFGYGNPQGASALREAVVGWLARNRGIRADPAEVVVVGGVAQALALLAHVLREEGGVHRVAVEDPGSLGARQQLEYGRMETVPVPVDEAGLDVAALRASGAGAVLLTPAHQFPTGVVLDGERRRDLLGWAAAGGLVIEDDYDAEHRYDRAPVPALRALLPEGVCYAGSVSKLLAPALRLGWLLVPPRLLDAVTAAKRYADLGNPVLAQLVLARLMDSGELERHLRHVRRRHRRRRDAMLRAVAELLPGARVHGAAAGLHLMVTFDGAGFEDTALASAALALGVKTHPLSWHRVRPGPPGLILGYAAGSAGEIEEGIATLATALAGVDALPETGRKVFPERRQPPGGSRVVRG